MEASINSVTLVVHIQFTRKPSLYLKRVGLCVYITQWAKMTSVPLKIENKTGMSAFTSLINIVLEVLATAGRQEGMKASNWKGRRKTAFICRYMILYRQNPKDPTRKLPELINEFSKVAGYKIHIQKLVAFLYANNELTKMEIKKTIPYTIASKR